MGFPAGVVNLVNGLGETAGKALTEHPAIKAVAFVGETTTGSRIMRQGAATLKRVHFELGGKNPVIVFDDSDQDRALDAGADHDLLAQRRALHLVVARAGAARRSTTPSPRRRRSGSPQSRSATLSTLRPRSGR